MVGFLCVLMVLFIFIMDGKDEVKTICGAVCFLACLATVALIKLT